MPSFDHFDTPIGHVAYTITEFPECADKQQQKCYIVNGIGYTLSVYYDPKDFSDSDIEPYAVVNVCDYDPTYVSLEKLDLALRFCEEAKRCLTKNIPFDVDGWLEKK